MALVICYAAGGTLNNFLEFTVSDAVVYSRATALCASAGLFLQYLINRALFFYPYIAVAAAIAILLITAKHSLEVFVLPVVFFVLSFFSVCAGMFFYPHYFIFLIPAASLLGGTAVSVLYFAVREKNNRRAVLLIVLSVVIPVLISFSVEKRLLFQETPEKLCKIVYAENPFVESLKIAEYISQNTSENDRILVLGSEPQICFYSRRKSSTGYMFMSQMAMAGERPLQMQEQAIAEIEKNMPKYVVFVHVGYSWGTKDMFRLPVVKWFAGIRLKKFERAGVIDLVAADKTSYVFGEEAKKYKILSGYFIEIYKLKKG